MRELRDAKKTIQCIIFLSMPIARGMEECAVEAEDVHIAASDTSIALSRSNAKKIPILRNAISNTNDSDEPQTISTNSINYLLQLHATITGQKESELYDFAHANDTPLLIKLYREIKSKKSKDLQKIYAASVEGSADCIRNAAMLCLAESIEEKKIKTIKQISSHNFYQEMYDIHPALRYRAGKLLEQKEFDAPERIATIQCIPKSDNTFALTNRDIFYVAPKKATKKENAETHFLSKIKKIITAKDPIVATAQSPSKNILVVQCKSNDIAIIDFEALSVIINRQEELKERSILAVDDKKNILFRGEKNDVCFFSIAFLSGDRKTLLFAGDEKFLKTAQIKAAQLRMDENNIYLGYHFIASGKIQIRSLNGKNQKIFNTKEYLKQCSFYNQCALSVGNYVKVWDLRNSKKAVREMRTNQKPECAILHANGMVMAHSEATGICFSDTRNGKVFKKIDTKTPITNLSFNQNGRVLLGHNQNTAIIYQLENKKEKKISNKLKNPKEFLVFSKELHHLDRHDCPKKLLSEYDTVKAYIAPEKKNDNEKIRRGSSPRPFRKKLITKKSGSAVTKTKSLAI